MMRKWSKCWNKMGKVLDTLSRSSATTLISLYKNLFYKNVQAEKAKKIRTSVRTCPASNIENNKNIQHRLLTKFSILNHAWIWTIEKGWKLLHYPFVFFLSAILISISNSISHFWTSWPIPDCFPASKHRCHERERYW